MTNVIMVGLATVSASVAAEPGTTVGKETLTLQGARLAILAATAVAKKVGAPGAGVAVVDDGGNVICVERLDGTFTAAWRISIGKARTAAMFAKPTSFFEKVIRDGRTPMVALEDFTPLQGGVPIVIEGQLVGAIGVSGASSAQQDEDLAIVGAAAVVSASAKAQGAAKNDVTFIAASRVSEAFRKDETLVDDAVRNFKVNASRRDAPGPAEVHQRETDIFHVLSGSATLVTGGVLSEPTTDQGRDEVRGTTIEGGDTRQLAAGDVVVIPKGTPHWFREVGAPLIYYVVKVR
jgi:glc operon protein GlcG